jgi:hypothetical protein
MSRVIRNIDPTLRPAFVAGEDTLAGWRGGGGSIFWKTQDTALYSTYIVSSLLLMKDGENPIVRYGRIFCLDPW